MSLKSLVGIIDYGMGNIKSVQKALSHIGVGSKIVDNPNALQDCTHIILPGVGAFGEAVKNLKNTGLFEAIRQNTKPLLGICLGMQLLAESSEESPGAEGLGLIKGRVTKLKTKKLPHVGWNKVHPEGSDKWDNYYFVHSYHLEPVFYYEDGSYRLQSVWSCEYNDDFFIALVKSINGKIWAVQFHPEKSQQKGLELLREFVCLPSE